MAAKNVYVICRAQRTELNKKGRQAVIGLFKHNQTAYDKASAMPAARGTAAVVHHAGTGYVPGLLLMPTTQRQGKTGKMLGILTGDRITEIDKQTEKQMRQEKLTNEQIKQINILGALNIVKKY